VQDYPPRLKKLSAVNGEAFRVIRYGPEVGQFGELWEAARAGRYPPVAVLIHGGFWRARYRLDLMHSLAADLRSRGYAVWNLEYRRIGMAGGGWPGTFTDVAAGMDILADLGQEYRLDTSRTVAVGHSAGGHLALWSAARHRLPDGWGRPRVTPAAVVSLAGVCDLVRAAQLRLSNGAVTELLGGTPSQVPRRYAQACPRQLLPLGTAQTTVHGTADDDVPIELSSGYRDAAVLAGDRCKFLPVVGADHFDLIDPAAGAWAQIVGLLT
jgi:acetyl esterase/lipase